MSEPVIVAMSNWVCELRAPRSGEVVGALAQGGVALLPDPGVMRPAEVGGLLEQAEHTLEQRPAPLVTGREVVLVDDCGHCPLSAVVAVASLRELGARRVILAGPGELLAELHEVVDGVVELTPS
jgi:hypothetical protein